MHSSFSPNLHPPTISAKSSSRRLRMSSCREVAVDEADGGVPHAARDSDAALVVHDVTQPGRLRGLEPVVHGGRDVRADKGADSHLSEGVFAVQRVRVPEGVGEARHPVVLALVEPVSRVVVALLAADDHHVVRAELLGRDSRLGNRDGRRRLRLLILLTLLALLALLADGRFRLGVRLGVVGLGARGVGDVPGRDGGKLSARSLGRGGVVILGRRRREVRRRRRPDRPWSCAWTAGAIRPWAGPGRTGATTSGPRAGARFRRSRCRREP